VGMMTKPSNVRHR